VVEEYHVTDIEKTVNDILYEVDQSKFILAPYVFLGCPFDYLEVTRGVDSYLTNGWELVSTRTSKSGNEVFKIRKENISFNKVRVN
jgi:hypothetical protein